MLSIDFADDWNNATTFTSMIEVMLGSFILLPCNPPMANPPPEIRWTLNSQPLDTSDITKYKTLLSGDLIIGSILEADIFVDGTFLPNVYQCHVINYLIYQTITSPIAYQLLIVCKLYYVTVYVVTFNAFHYLADYTDNLTIFDTLEDTILQIGTDAEFTCIAVANDMRLDYMYRRTDGNALDSNIIAPTPSTSVNIDRRHTMFINGVTEANAGEYQCAVRDFQMGQSLELVAIMFNISVFGKYI